MNYVVKPIQTSHFYLPTRASLNDPTEGVFRNSLDTELKGYLQGVYGVGEQHDLMDKVYSSARQIVRNIDTSGIFSLTENPTDELMWAHYADSHQGIAIEYDLELLTRFVPNQHLHIFDVIYDKKTPLLGINSIASRNAMQVMFGYKSPRWHYEDECRVVTDNISGQMPHDYRAVKSITFGYRFPEEKRDMVIDLLKDRVQNFYRIVLNENSYTFTRETIKRLPNESSKVKLDIAWDYHLAGFLHDDKLELIDRIENLLKLDPHYSQLISAEKSTIERDKVAVHYELGHENFELQLSAEYQKVMV